MKKFKKSSKKIKNAKSKTKPELPHKVAENKAVPQAKIKKSQHRRPRKFKEKPFLQTLAQITDGTWNDPVLDLSRKHLDRHAADQLATALARNQTITELNISYNQIGDEGIVPLSRMLERNKKIRVLDIQFNRLTKKGTKHMLSCLNNNVFITELYMDEEQTNLGEIITGAGESHLNPINEAVIRQLERLLDENRNFQALLVGKSSSLELPDRKQSMVNVSILEKFPYLTRIDLSMNRLKTIPQEIKILSKLEELILSDNRISALPVELGECTKLKTLLLDKNQLKEMPLSITNLPNLETLSLRNNKFEDLPRFSLGSMQKLSYLDVRGNPLTQMSCLGSAWYHMLEKDDGRHALSFLKENNKGTTEIFRAKLMFVGNGNVGKTTLLHNFTRAKRITTAGQAPTAQPVSSSSRLRTKSNLKENVQTNLATDGIDIHRWDVKHPACCHKDENVSSENIVDIGNKYINFLCWDFAGQEVYYSTHGFFLSQRAVYILVFNLLKSLEENKIEFWLQSIHSRTDSSPVILVGTFFDDKRCTKEFVEHYFNKISATYSKRFQKNIKGCYFVSNESMKGIPELKQRVIDLALEQEFMPDFIPLSYLALEEKLLGAKQSKYPPVLTWSEYVRLAIECEIDEGDLITATHFLNDLGSLAYFSDKDEDLKDMVVVDPQWITKTFATIISLKLGFVRNGVLKISDLPQIWKEPVYEKSMHNALIKMLEKFQVVSRLVINGADSLLIPCMLPDVPPEESMYESVWPQYEDGVAQLGRSYYFEFLPLGFFSRLIVRFLQSLYRPLLYWASGIILAKDTERVSLTVTRTTYDLPICLRLLIRGAEPGKHLVHLVDSIDTLISDWLKFKADIKVPCTHCISEGQPEPYQFPLELIAKTVSMNETHVVCRGVTDVLISEMAPDITMSEFEGGSVDYKDVEKLKMIGEGGFAKVYKSIWNNEVIALKELILEQPDEEYGFDDGMSPLDVFTEFRREVYLMSCMVHQNIVQLKGLCISPFCMLLEFCDKGSLYDYIHDEKELLTWPIKLKIAEDIARGMYYMHNYKPPLIHRDLKSPNVLMKIEYVEEYGYPTIVAKVADFGLSRSLLLAGALKSKVVDNPVWLAPEIMEGKPYDEKVDVYSYGVIMWETVTREDFLGHISFMSAIEEAVLNGVRPDIPDECAQRFPEFKELIELCWHNSSDKRPSFKKCIKILEELKENRFAEKPPEMKLDAPQQKQNSFNYSKPRSGNEMQLKSAKYANDRSVSSVPQRRLPRPAPTNPLRGVGQAPRSIATVVQKNPQQMPMPRNKPAFLPARRGQSEDVLSTVNNGKPNYFASRSSPDVRQQQFRGQRMASMASFTSGDVAKGTVMSKTMDVEGKVVKMLVWDDYVWCGCDNGQGFAFDKSTGEFMAEVKLQNSRITGMVLANNKTELWTCGVSDNTINVWDRNGEHLASIPTKINLHCLQEFSHAREDKHVSFVWAGGAQTKDVQTKLRSYESSLGFINVYLANSKKLKKTIKIEPYGDYVIKKSSPTPTCILFHGNHMWATANTRIYCYEPYSYTARGFLEGHNDCVNTLCSVNNEMWSGASDKLILVWDPKNNGSDIVASMEGHSGDIEDICTDGSLAWSCGWDNKIFVWDVQAHRFKKWATGPGTGSISCVLYEEESQKLWTGGQDKVCIWE